jgi:hypothetical protein
MKTRIIHAAKPNGDILDERLYFTDDRNTPAEEFFPSGYKIESDTLHEIKIPSGFPMEYEFKKGDPAINPKKKTCPHRDLWTIFDSKGKRIYKIHVCLA